MMAKLVPKVLFFEAGIAGGSVNRLINLLSGLDGQGVPYGVFTIYNRSKSAELLRGKGACCKKTLAFAGPRPPEPLRAWGRVALPTLDAARYFLAALSFIARSPGATVYLNNPPYVHLPVLAAATLLQRPIVCHLRDTVSLTRVEKLLLPLIDAFVALSHAGKEFYQRQGVAQGKIRVIYDSIDAARFHGRGEPPETGPVRAVVVGAIHARKAQEVCVRALELAVKIRPELQLLLVGGGDADGALRRQINEAHLQGNVAMLGHSEDVPELLAGCHIGILTSRREGMPNSVMEYMAAGLPVIVTDVPGIEELVTEGSTGFIVPRDCPEAVAEKWLLLADDAAARRTMGDRARGAIAAHPFDPATELRQVMQVIDDVGKMPKPGRQP